MLSRPLVAVAATSRTCLALEREGLERAVQGTRPARAELVLRAPTVHPRALARARLRAARIANTLAAAAHT